MAGPKFIADNQAAAFSITPIGVRGEEVLHFLFNGSLEHLAGPVSHDFVQCAAAFELRPEFEDFLINLTGLWNIGLRFRSVTHGVSLCPRRAAEENYPSAGYAAFLSPSRTRLSTISLFPGRLGTLTHDYKRNGTTTLFAALSVADGTVITQCQNRHRHQEWIKFLKTIDRETVPELDLHLIVDNYATHKHPKVKAWLKRHPRFHLHFTPTSSSWLNVIERWFRELTEKRLRRGVFKSVAEVEQAIGDFVEHHNQNPRGFNWVKKADEILAKVSRAKAALDNTPSE